MAKINLLPWRAELRKQQKQDFLMAIAGGALVSAGIMLLVHANVDGKLQQQNRRNQYLNDEIAVLDRKIKEIQELEAKKSKLISKMEIIQQLQVSRPEIVHLFAELARTVPDGVYVNQITQNDKSLTLNGSAQSNARVSAYMRNMESSRWLRDPVLNVIETRGDSKNGRVSAFTMNVQQRAQTGGDKSDKAGGK